MNYYSILTAEERNGDGVSIVDDPFNGGPFYRPAQSWQMAKLRDDILDEAALLFKTCADAVMKACFMTYIEDTVGPNDEVFQPYACLFEHPFFACIENIIKEKAYARVRHGRNRDKVSVSLFKLALVTSQSWSREKTFSDSPAWTRIQLEVDKIVRALSGVLDWSLFLSFALATMRIAEDPYGVLHAIKHFVRRSTKIAYAMREVLGRDVMFRPVDRATREAFLTEAGKCETPERDRAKSGKQLADIVVRMQPK